MSQVLALLLSFFPFIITTSLHANSIDCVQHHCLAVVDAGSTGSRLHIYAYDLDKHNTPINIKQKWLKKINPGFATLENQTSMDAYLDSLFADAPITYLPIYFYATAGMRLLSQPKQQKLYAQLTHWFNQQSQWTLVKAKTITGNEEALFGWLSINSQLGTLIDKTKTPVGVMDMGGASVQIIFPVKKTQYLKTKNKENLNLYGRHFTLFVHSFLGLGQTEISHQFLNSSACFANNYQLPDGLSAEGNASQCKNEVSFLMNKVHHVNNIVQPILHANLVKEWYVMGGVVYMVKNKPFNFPATAFNNQTLLTEADRDVCHQQWSTLSLQYPLDDHLYGYCLFSSYYYALMVKGYGLAPKQMINYMQADQGGDWTLGVVLHQAA